MEDNLKKIYSADKMYKVKIIQELLEENNVESFVLNQKGSAFLVGDIHLYVDKKDETKAMELLKDNDI